MASEMSKTDLYLILGVSETATSKEIVRGYRKRALKCHPDKNKDNPKATDLFLELSKALEILTDEVARAAYDQSRKAKKAAEERNKVLDVKRKKFKDDLEAKERLFENNLKVKRETAEMRLEKEIERLRKEGSRLLREEQERLRQELLHTDVECEDKKFTNTSDECEVPRLKLKWKARKDDAANGGYNSDMLHSILSCYGQVNTLLVSDKRNGSAIVEFEKSGVSSDILEEKGLVSNPLTFTWLSGKPTQRKVSEFSIQNNLMGSSDRPFDNSNDSLLSKKLHDDNSRSNCQANSCSDLGGSGVADKDYESLVLMRMRQAEERKRLIERMKQEDNNDEV